MAGYSGTPLVKKLGIKNDHRVALVNSPPEFENLLEGLPIGTEIVRELAGEKVDVMVFFPDNLGQLRKRFHTLAKRLQPAGGLWVAWPKKAAGVATDLSENEVRAIGLEAG